MRDDHNDLKNRSDTFSRRITANASGEPRPPRIVLEIGHNLFLLPRGTNHNEVHNAAALLARSTPVAEDYTDNAMAGPTFKKSPPIRVRFSLVAETLVPPDDGGSLA